MIGGKHAFIEELYQKVEDIQSYIDLQQSSVRQIIEYWIDDNSKWSDIDSKDV